MRNVSAPGATTALLVAAAAYSCGPGTTPPPMDAGGELGRLEGGSNVATMVPSNAFEGQRRFVAYIGPPLFEDTFDTAQVSASMMSGIVLEQVVCARLHCAVSGHVDDVTPNRGAAIPEPVSAMQHTIGIVAPMYNYRAQLQIFPTDTAEGAALGSGGIASDAVYSRITVQAGAMLRGALETPVRIAVLGPAEIHGTFDFSAMGAAAGPGGHAGGMPPMGDGQGPLFGGGAANAGGGGGNGTAGSPGMGADSMPGGTGGMAAMNPRALAGGSGGGAGGGGAGGGGGGALVMALYGTANLEGARFALRGGAGEGAGGGGAGGMLVFGSSAEPTGAYTVDVSGGAGGTAGGARGGAGGNGRVRYEGATGQGMVAGTTAGEGVRFDVASVPPIVREPMLTIRGFAPPNTRVRVQNERGDSVVARQDGMADASGAWSVQFRLSPGYAQFIAYDLTNPMAPVPSMSGTTVVIRGAGGARQIYSGAIDTVYLEAE